MYEFNAELFKKCVWYYAKKQSVITPITWEEIIGRSTNSHWISGDHFMADVVNPEYLSNVKTLKLKFNKSNKQTLSFVQCRTPISNDRNLTDEELGENIIQTLIDKRDESFKQKWESYCIKKGNKNIQIEDFYCCLMKDFVIQHYREENKYFARVFCYDHPDYKSYDLKWKDGKGKFEDQKSWFIMRDYSDAKHGQNCTHIKKIFTDDCLICNVMVECPDEHNVSNETIEQEYEKFFGLSE
jgi:hypothetical protein